MQIDLKQIGAIAKFVWNTFFAGKVVVVKGQPITLPKLDQQPALETLDQDPIHLHSLMGEE